MIGSPTGLVATISLALVCGSLLAEEKVVVCHGDSITAGSHLSDREKYPAVLESLLANARVINSGIGGNTSGQGLARLEKDVLRHKPDVVVLLFGTNDSVLTAAKRYRVPVDKYRENLRQMADRCQKSGARVVLCTLLPIIAEPYYTRHPRQHYEAEGGLVAILRRYHSAATDVGKEMKVPVVDLYALFEKDLTLLRPAPDGVHPNARGAKAIAEAVAAVIAPSLRSR